MFDLLDFLSLQDANVRYVVLGSILLGVGAGVVGCFTFLRKRALVGDAVAHSVLPGLALAFIFFQTKNAWVLLAGATLSGWLSLISIDAITKYSRIKTDSAIGLILSVFFGIGILLMTSIQHSGNASQSGLDTFLFGKAASMLPEDVWAFGIVSLVLIVVVAFFFREFTLISFDEAYARSIGIGVNFLGVILSTLTVLAIAVGIQAVGVVLMAALLITPAAAARYWTDNLKVMVLLSATFGAISGVFGSYISYIAPAMPTGPWIVLMLTFIAFLSILFAPRGGLLRKARNRKMVQQKMADENILKAFYQLGEKDTQYFSARSMQNVMDQRQMQQKLFKKSVSRLKRKSMLQAVNGHWQLTEKGKAEGKRITKLHRLWEVYLTQYLRIAPDHVHDDAEAMEHVITPEIEERLEKLLQKPDRDPHDSEIPY